MKSSSSIRFSRSCPTCGRRVEIRAVLLGHTVACQHCSAHFVATASNDYDLATINQESQLMARVQRALDSSVTDTTAIG